MINIRYHIVSITAVFLALGIGVALGSTFLDRATVGRLDDNIRNAEARIDDTEAESERLRGDLAAAEQRDVGLIGASEVLLDGRLTDRPVLLVSAPGVDQGTIDTLRLILDNADADLRGTFALRDGLSFPGEEVDDGLAEALLLDDTDSDAARAEVYDRLVEVLAAAGAPAEEVDGPTDPEDPTTTTEDPATTTTVPGPTVPGDTTSTTTPTTGATVPEGTTSLPPDEVPGPDAIEVPGAPDGTQPDIVTALIENDLVTLDPGPGYDAEDPILEDVGYQYVFVSQPDLPPAADQLLLNLLPGSATAPALPAVVVSDTPEPVEDTDDNNPTAVDLVRDDASRAVRYDTVDDIDTYLGLSSTVTLLSDAAGPAAGHYGQGQGATALAPAGR